MSQVVGYKSRLVLDFETAFNTPPVTPAGIVMPVNSFSLKSKRALNTANTFRGTRNPVKPFSGNLQDSGSTVIPVDERAFGYWLKGMFGAPTTTGAQAPYTHVFKVGPKQPSMVMEARYADEDGVVVTHAKHTGAKISTFGMSIGGDGELVANLGLEAANEAHSATPYDATPTELSFDRFENFQAAITEGGAPIAIVTALDFSINFNLATDQYVIGGGGIRGSLTGGILAATGSITALFDSMTLLDKAMDLDESSLVVTFTSGTHSLAFAFNELIFERNTPGIEGPQGVVITLPFVGYMDDDAAASVVVATLINDVTAYA